MSKSKKSPRRKQPCNTNKTLKENIKNFFINNPTGAFNYKQVAGAVDANDAVARNLVKEIMHDMESNDVLAQYRRGKFKINPEHLPERVTTQALITGKVDMKQTGKAYIITDALEEDIYIGSSHTGHALHGDLVQVRLFPQRKGHKLEGRIMEIVKRAKTRFVGTIERSQKFAFMVSDSSSMPVDIFIPLSELKDAKNGQKVVVEITDWPAHANNPFGKVEEVLGTPGDNEVEMKAILVEHDFPLSFSKEVEKDAAKIKIEISKEEIGRRRDCRAVNTFTIDPADAKDFDDALSYQKLENGNHEVGIHIADVSFYVQQKSALDDEAYDRATSIYLVDRVIPMLPEVLSNNVCSLRPKEDKLCFSAIFELDDKARVIKEWYGKTIINSDHRLNYDEAQHIIETGEGAMAEEITTLNRLAIALREERFKKGAIDFHTEEVKFILDEKGKPVDVYVKEPKESNHLIEDFMLLANRKVAERIGRKRGTATPKTFVYRVHDEPSPEKLDKFRQFVGRLGYTMRIGSERSLAKSFNDLFEQVHGRGEENMVESLAVRTMAKAEYSTHNIGHYGLAFPYYTHFTSPIRRYPDLMVHRLLQQYLDKKPSASEAEYEEKCKHSSEMERKAVEAERASIKYKQAEYMSDKIGQEFDGLISGVSKYGIFVEIKSNKCEGMVRLSDLEDDFYYLDEDNYKVIGHRNGQEFKLGDPIRIRVKQIDLRKKQLDYTLA
ncbi:MAG TPA: ribonuclease R [Bacteroidales bacterium]|nr:ribonuclease R [Bacteroidales bacterium]